MGNVTSIYYKTWLLKKQHAMCEILSPKKEFLFLSCGNYATFQDKNCLTYVHITN